MMLSDSKLGAGRRRRIGQRSKIKNCSTSRGSMRGKKLYLKYLRYVLLDNWLKGDGGKRAERYF
jgi:hypothetical protein